MARPRSLQRRVQMTAELTHLMQLSKLQGARTPHATAEAMLRLCASYAGTGAINTSCISHLLSHLRTSAVLYGAAAPEAALAFMRDARLQAVLADLPHALTKPRSVYGVTQLTYCMVACVRLEAAAALALARERGGRGRPPALDAIRDSLRLQVKGLLEGPPVEQWETRTLTSLAVLLSGAPRSGGGGGSTSTLNFMHDTFRPLVTAMLDAFARRGAEAAHHLHAVELPALCHMLLALIEYSVPASHAAVPVILRALGDRANATLAMSRWGGASAGPAADAAAAAAREEGGVPALGQGDAAAGGGGGDAGAQQRLQLLLQQQSHAAAMHAAYSESDGGMRARFFASESEDASRTFAGAGSAGAGAGASPAPASSGGGGASSGSSAPDHAAAGAPPATSSSAAAAPLGTSGSLGSGSSNSGAVPAAAAAAAGAPSGGGSSPRAPQLCRMDVTTISIILDAVTKLPRLVGVASGSAHYESPAFRAVLAAEVETVWRPLAAALATLDLSQANARDVGVILATLARANAMVPALLTKLRRRVCTLDSNALWHPRAYTNIIIGLADAGCRDPDVWLHLFGCLSQTLGLCAAAQVAKPAAAGAAAALGASAGGAPPPSVSVSLPALVPSEGGGGRGRAPHSFSLPQLASIFARWPTAPAGQGAELLRIAAPLVLAQLRLEEAALAATAPASTPWYARASELLNAYAILVNTPYRLRAGTSLLRESLTMAASLAAQVIVTHRAALAASGAVPPPPRPGDGSDGGAAEPGPPSTDDQQEQQQQQQRQPPVVVAARRDPFHGPTLTMLVAALGFQHVAAPAFFTAAASHLEYLLLHTNPAHSRLLPAHVSVALHALVTAGHAERGVFAAAALYMRWVLRSPKLGHALLPDFFVTLLEAFTRVGGLADAALFADVGDYLAGGAADDDDAGGAEGGGGGGSGGGGGGERAAGAAVARDRFGRRPERWGHQRTAPPLPPVADGGGGGGGGRDGCHAAAPAALGGPPPPSGDAGGRGSGGPSSSPPPGAAAAPPPPSVFAHSIDARRITQRPWGLSGFTPAQLAQLRASYAAAGVRHARLAAAIAAASAAHEEDTRGGGGGGGWERPEPGDRGAAAARGGPAQPAAAAAWASVLDASAL